MAMTYAYSGGPFLGMGAGLLAGIGTNNVAVGIVVAIVASIAAFYLIRVVETLIGRGVNAGVAAATNLLQQHSSPAQHPQQPSRYAPPPNAQWPPNEPRPR